MALRIIPKPCAGKLSSHSGLLGHFGPRDAWSLAVAPCSMSMAVPCTRVPLRVPT